jgi:hypothetical protein
VTASPADHRTPVRVDFIVGMARSGTTWLGRALGSHPAVAVFGETNFFGRLYVPPRGDGTYGERELKRVRELQQTREWSATTGDASGCLTNTPPSEYPLLVDRALQAQAVPSPPADVFARLATEVAVTERKTRVLEKTPHHVHWLARIAESFPNARFVVVHREPYGFALSFKHLGRRIETTAGRMLDRPWRHPLICALAWRAYMLSIERALDSYRGRILLVDTADLRTNPIAVLEKIQSFLGVAIHQLEQPPPRETSSFRDLPQAELTPEDVLWLNLVAGRVMYRNGYRVRRAPVRPLHLAASVATAFASLAYGLVLLPGQVEGSLLAYLRTWLGGRRVISASRAHAPTRRARRGDTDQAQRPSHS